MRFFLATLLAVLGCHATDRGAVSVRWKIVDLQSGEPIDPRLGCERKDQDGCGWKIDQIGIELSNEAALACSKGNPRCFRCDAREATTQFDVATGEVGISLRALGADGLPLQGVVSPPPLTYNVVANQIVSLDILQLGVDPPPPQGSPSCAQPQ